MASNTIRVHVAAPSVGMMEMLLPGLADRSCSASAAATTDRRLLTPPRCRCLKDIVILGLTGQSWGLCLNMHCGIRLRDHTGDEQEVISMGKGKLKC